MLTSVLTGAWQSCHPRRQTFKTRSWRHLQIDAQIFRQSTFKLLLMINHRIVLSTQY